MNEPDKKLYLAIAVLLVWAIAATVALVVREPKIVIVENSVPAESVESSVPATASVPATSKSARKTPVVKNEEPEIAQVVVLAPEPQLATRQAKKPRKPLASFRDVGEICIDAQTGKFLTGTRPDAPCPPASVTKVMTFYLVLDAIEKGQIKLDDIVTTSRRAEEMGGTQLYLSAGEQANVSEMLYGLMLQSANDGAVALAEHVSGNVEKFVELMNATARELGMNNTRFATPHGLPPSRKLKNAPKDLSTARDLAILTYNLIKRFPQALDYTATKTRYFPANAKRKEPMPMLNHNKLLTYFEGCDGFKTGWTNDGASIVTTASRGNTRVIAVVLGGLVKNRKGQIDAKTSQVERNQRAAELMYTGFQMLDVLKYEPTPHKPQLN